MLEGAVKFKKQGLSSYAKIKAIQRALKQSLVKGDISMYKSNSKLDTSYVTANWSASVKNNLRSGN